MSINQRYVSALLNNHSAVLNEMHKEFYPGIKRMVLQNKGSEPDADDVYQEACISMFCKAKAGKLILTKGFDSYFYTVCRNIWIDYLKRKKEVFTETGMNDNTYSSENDFQNKEKFIQQEQRFELFEAKFIELGDRCKELLLLRWSGKSMKEIAELTHLTPNYVRKKVCISKERIEILMVQSSNFVSLKI